MEAVITEWLRDPPYTRPKKRLKPLIVLMGLVTQVSYTKTRRFVFKALEEALKGELGRIWMRDRCVRRTIRLYGANDQRTAGWHTKRGEMITGSEVSQVFTGGETRRSLIIRKLVPPQPATPGQYQAPLIWGTRFEPIAKAIYEEETGCKIVDVSCVQHPVYPFLGASPDGIVFPTDPTDVHRRGRLVEFKCPFSRPPSDGVPEAYNHQMQMQMECSGIDECEYVEFRFKQVFSSEWIRSTVTKGVFAVFPDETLNYKPPDMELNMWQKGLDHDADPQFIYWILMSTKKAFVPKDLNWLPRHLPALQSAWDEVLLHREAGTHPAPVPKASATLDI
jgi:putative phage-type endonuclease